jgi:fatty-acid desaturase
MLRRTLRYLSIKQFSFGDWLFLIFGLAIPEMGLMTLIAIITGESIGYFQHDSDFLPIDNSNKLEHLLSFGSGEHSNHHGNTASYKINTFTPWGLLAMWLYLIIMPLLSLFGSQRIGELSRECRNVFEDPTSLPTIIKRSLLPSG